VNAVTVLHCVSHCHTKKNKRLYLLFVWLEKPLHASTYKKADTVKSLKMGSANHNETAGLLQVYIKE